MALVFFEPWKKDFLFWRKLVKYICRFMSVDPGTDGKNVGEWYPFFGYDATWLIKGSVNKENGKIDYGLVQK